MPTKRTRRRRPTRLQLTGALQTYIESGDYHGGEDLELYKLAGALLRGKDDQVRELWQEHGETILAEWIREHPGTRPFAWWICQAMEPRHVLEGAEHLQPFAGEVWRRDFGIPPVEQIGHFSATVESEASYLARLRLLAAGERRRLTAEDFAPEEIIVDLETLEELTARRLALAAPRGPNGHGDGEAGVVPRRGEDHRIY